MHRTTDIKIDIDVHRAIETRRTGFNQSHNDILREIFGLSKAQNKNPGPSPADLLRPRRTRTYAFELLGERVEEGNLKTAYMSCLRKLAELDHQFLDELSKEKTRSRKIIARDPKELYLKTPGLSEKFAVHLMGQWWIDTNLSQSQVEWRLEQACAVADLQFGSDLVLDFPK